MLSEGSSMVVHFKVYSRDGGTIICVNMMTSSNGNIFRVTGHLCREFTGPRWITRRPVTRNFDVFFDQRSNKLSSEQLWGWLFETPSRPLWRHRNELSPCCRDSYLCVAWQKTLLAISATSIYHRNKLNRSLWDVCDYTQVVWYCVQHN